VPTSKELSGHFDIQCVVDLVPKESHPRSDYRAAIQHGAFDGTMRKRRVTTSGKLSISNILMHSKCMFRLQLLS
jgi:hypothetical protein